MNLIKSLSTLSLSFGLLVGAATLLAPSEAKAANNKSGHISFDALKKNNAGGRQNARPGQPANKWTRGCSAINRCRG